MATYGDRLEHALRLAQKDRTALSDEIGISIQAIGQVISGKTKALTAENSAKAARFLGVDHVWLATGSGVPTGQPGEPAKWPFRSISVESVLALSAAEIEEVEDDLRHSVQRVVKRRSPKKSTPPRKTAA